VSVGVKVVLLVEKDIMGKHLHPYIESRTLRVFVYVLMVMDSSAGR
jgi:hypothetical protein